MGASYVTTEDSGHPGDNQPHKPQKGDDKKKTAHLPDEEHTAAVSTRKQLPSNHTTWQLTQCLFKHLRFGQITGDTGIPCSSNRSSPACPTPHPATGQIRVPLSHSPSGGGWMLVLPALESLEELLYLGSPQTSRELAHRCKQPSGQPLSIQLLLCHPETSVSP